jgi:hypothetical protein
MERGKKGKKSQFLAQFLTRVLANEGGASRRPWRVCIVNCIKAVAGDSQHRKPNELNRRCKWAVVFYAIW